MSAAHHPPSDPSTMCVTSASLDSREDDHHNNEPTGNSPHSRRRHHHHHHARNGGKSGRLWQLPQSSIQEYAAWIEQKPPDTQTPSEQRFLQKFQRHMLIRRQKRPKESMKHYIARLEAKEHISDVELQLIEQYHRRKAHRRSQRYRRDNNPFRGNSVPPPIFWRRESPSNRNQPLAASVTLMSTMANLQESMNRMGLSSDKLRDIPMEDNNNSVPSILSTNPFSTGHRENQWGHR